MKRNYSLWFYSENDKKILKRKSLLNDRTPDYNFELYAIDEKETISSKIAPHLEYSNRFYDLNYGDLLVTVYNVYKNFKWYSLNSEINYKYAMEYSENECKDIQKCDMDILRNACKLADYSMFFLEILDYVGSKIIGRNGNNGFNQLDYLEDFFEQVDKACGKDTSTYYSGNERFRFIPPISVVIEPSVEDGIPTYFFSNFEDVLIFELYEVLKGKTIIRMCENCGRYFIPTARSDEIYCNNPFKENKTCKQLGYEIKLNQDEFLKPYRTAYKTQHAKMQRNKRNVLDYKEKHFDIWVTNAKEKLKLAQNGVIPLEEFKNWLNENK